MSFLQDIMSRHKPLCIIFMHYAKLDNENYAHCLTNSFMLLCISIAGHNPYNNNRLLLEFHHKLVANNRTHGNICG